MNTPTAKKNKPVVLIVDDNMAFVERIIGLLDEVKNNVDITIASDYEEANRLLAADKPDMVLLDINLPGKNGIELLRKIKSPDKECRVIMMTNHTDEYYRGLCKELGADHFLDKTNDFGKVPEIINARYGI